MNYINQQYVLYVNIKKTYIGNLKNLCNNQELRNHLAETISVMCLSPKDEIVIPEEVSTNKIDSIIVNKTNKFVSMFLKNISPQSVMYQNFYQYAINYFNNNISNCIYYIAWFMNDVEYVIDVDMKFKIPPILAKKSILLIIKFLILQIKTQIKMNHKHQMVNEVTETLNTVISVYFNTYKKKDYETCTYIITYIMILARDLDNFINSDHPLLYDTRVVQQCSEINLLYQKIQNTSSTIVQEPVQTKKKNTRKGKADTREQFYENPQNIEYLNLIYNTDLLRTAERQDLCQSTIPHADQITSKSTDHPTDRSTDHSTVHSSNHSTSPSTIDSEPSEPDDGSSDQGDVNIELLDDF
jgi:hypothetical protein